ncbi:MAG: efflux RND transporter periplasmic adaptor subunit, partial [Deltaproteobacteria bacterium]|nr:efflux RND transporter periplasmic adaptor subunit [Deltaproteobacteria bacterium]
MGKKIVFPIVLILLLLLSFWMGKVTGQRSKDAERTSHTEAFSVAAKSTPETAPHAHKEGEADVHAEEKQEGQGLKLSSEEKTNIGLKTVTADLRPVENVIRVAGVVKAHPDREAHVSSRVSGKIASLSARVGDGVSKGQRLAEVQSAEIQKLQVELIQAENKLVLHKAELDRIQKLVESKIAAQKELIAAQNQHQAGLNEIEGLTQQLILLGLPEAAVKRARAEKTVSTFGVLSPIGGVVEERNVVLGETVEPNKVIFKIVDPSTVFIEGSAFDEALAQLKIGQTVRIRL